MQTNGNSYDPRIVTAIRGCISASTAIDQGNRGVLKVPVAKLVAGARLVSNVETEDGLRILAAGAEITQAQLEHLQNMHQVRALKEPIYISRPRPAAADQAG